MKQGGKTIKVDTKGTNRQSENKYRNDELRRMRKERDKWRRQCKKARKELKSCQEGLEKAGRVREAVERSRRKVKGHSCSSLQTDIAVKIRCNTSCSAGDVSRILWIFRRGHRRPA